MVTPFLLSISLMFSYCSKAFFFFSVSFEFKNHVVFIKSIKTILARRTLALQLYWAVSVFTNDARNLGWKADGPVIFLEIPFASFENFNAVPLVYFAPFIHFSHDQSPIM